MRFKYNETTDKPQSIKVVGSLLMVQRFSFCDLIPIYFQVKFFNNSVGKLLSRCKDAIKLDEHIIE